MRGRRERATGTSRPDTTSAWLLVTPMVLVLGLFLVLPVLMALYVSFTRWNGNGTPFDSRNAPFVGLDNYATILTRDGLQRRDLAQSIGNTFWYVLLVVPLQTASALLLALAVDARAAAARGIVRTAMYLPSVTSSIAVTTVFLFLFSGSGVVNALLALVGVQGPSWMADPRGLVHLALGAAGVHDPSWAQGTVLGRTVWDWLAGPSVAMTVLVALAVWTTSGTFMLMFLAALQDLPREIDEAAALDGATGWRKLRDVTIPQLRPTIVLVSTLGLIGTWQVFDQVYATGGGAPGKTLLTPAYLSYARSFKDGDFGTGAAIAFVVFLVVVALTVLQRRLLRRDDR